jgi:hypothetical protein
MSGASWLKVEFPVAGIENYVGTKTLRNQVPEVREEAA